MLSNVFYKKCPPRSGQTPWEVGRGLPGITPRDHSKCHVGDKEFPEVVAYVDAKSEERHPMHLRCTVVHPRYQKELYFEEPRSDVRSLTGSGSAD